MIRLLIQLLPAVAIFLASIAFAQTEVASLTQTPKKTPPKKASELIAKQAPPVVNKDVFEQITPPDRYDLIGVDAVAMGVRDLVIFGGYGGAV